MELDHPFIKLPFQFDLSQLELELDSLNEDAWMAHPSRMQGNAAVPLVSHEGGDNDDFAGRMLATPHLDRCVYIKQVMASFNEVIARSRLMRLAPGAEVNAHVDFNYHWYSRVRIHIPITTNPGVTFYCGGEQQYMQAGDCWIFDSWRRHRVVNNSDQSRVHLVIDTTGSSRFWQLVSSMNEFAPDFNQAAFQAQISKLEFDRDAKPQLKTEQYNVAPVMSPGEMEAIAKELMNDMHANPNNPADKIEFFERLLMELCKDWRQLWLQYGYEKAGLKHYQQLLEHIARRLPANPRELVTSNNDVGIRPIIMQRILRAALNPGELVRFKS